MSATNEVFPHPRAPTWWWIYYIITKPEEFQKAESYTGKPVVLMFSADWNEACKVMKKPFRETALSRKKDAVFCLVDIDKLKNDDTIVARYQVEALPTFVLLKNGRREGRAVVGAKMDEFTDLGKRI